MKVKDIEKFYDYERKIKPQIVDISKAIRTNNRVLTISSLKELRKDLNEFVREIDNTIKQIRR